LEGQRELINDNKKIKEVATLSAKDEEIGGLIATVMEKVGKEGIVTVDDSNTIGSSYEIVEACSSTAATFRAVHGDESGKDGVRARRAIRARDGQEDIFHPRHFGIARKDRGEW